MENNFQYKFRIKNKNKFLKKARSLDIKFTSPQKHIYTYFKIPNKSVSSFATLRIKESEDKKALDMKIRNDKTNKWQHFESAINDPEQVKMILEMLGCNRVFTFHKVRSTYITDFVRLDLDTTKELGTFLEVKFPLKYKKRAERLLTILGLDVTMHDKRSIIEIYLSGITSKK